RRRWMPEPASLSPLGGARRSRGRSRSAYRRTVHAARDRAQSRQSEDQNVRGGGGDVCCDACLQRLILYDSLISSVRVVPMVLVSKKVQVDTSKPRGLPALWVSYFYSKPYAALLLGTAAAVHRFRASCSSAAAACTSRHSPSDSALMSSGLTRPAAFRM